MQPDWFCCLWKQDGTVKPIPSVVLKSSPTDSLSLKDPQRCSLAAHLMSIRP